MNCLAILHCPILGGLYTCGDQLVILAVWVVQELLKPSEDLAHVFLLKDFMHGGLQAHCQCQAACSSCEGAQTDKLCC